MMLMSLTYLLLLHFHINLFILCIQLVFSSSIVNVKEYFQRESLNFPVDNNIVLNHLTDDLGILVRLLLKST